MPLPSAPAAFEQAAAAAAQPANQPANQPAPDGDIHMPGEQITQEDAAAAAAEDAARAAQEGPEGTDQPTGQDQQQQQSGEIAPLPDGGQEKFYDPKTGAYDWEAHGKQAAYDTLRKGKDKPAAKDESQAPADDKAQQAAANEAEVAAKLPDGVWDTINNEFAENGDISEQSREALNRVGVTDQVIDEHLEFKAWQVEQAQSAVFKTISDDFDQSDFELLQQWVIDNKEPGEIARIDKLLGDVDSAPMILKELVTEAAPALGGAARTAAPLKERQGKLLEAGNHQAPSGSTDAIKPFSSFAAMSQAQGDPRYGVDAEYTTLVDRRAVITPVQMGSGGQFA